MHAPMQPSFLVITLGVSMPMTSSTDEVNGKSTRWLAYASQWRSLNKNVHSTCNEENRRNVLSSLMTVITRLEAAYQAEYRGVVQYYLLAQNGGLFGKLQWVAETSLLK